MCLIKKYTISVLHSLIILSANLYDVSGSLVNEVREQYCLQHCYSGPYVRCCLHSSNCTAATSLFLWYTSIASKSVNILSRFNFRMKTLGLDVDSGLHIVNFYYLCIKSTGFVYWCRQPELEASLRCIIPTLFITD